MATLIIGRSYSVCGSCQENGRAPDANPSETGHYTVLGYGDKNGTPGCGEPWTAMTLNFVMNGPELDREHVMSVYPNLREVPFVSIVW